MAKIQALHHAEQQRTGALSTALGPGRLLVGPVRAARDGRHEAGRADGQLLAALPCASGRLGDGFCGHGFTHEPSAPGTQQHRRRFRGPACACWAGGVLPRPIARGACRAGGDAHYAGGGVEGGSDDERLPRDCELQPGLRPAAARRSTLARQVLWDQCASLRDCLYKDKPRFGSVAAGPVDRVALAECLEKLGRLWRIFEMVKREHIVV